MRRSLATILLGFLITSCTDVNRAIFVTSTDIGMNVDKSTLSANIGYDRTESFIGPAYPEEGTAPAAFAHMRSNLELFSPKVSQTYATGDAAVLVTRSDEKAKEEFDYKPVLHGNRRSMFFGTSTTVGAKIGFGVTDALPESLVFGYKRKELSVIPFRQDSPKEQQEDKYTPVLASVDLDLKSGTMPEVGLGIVQFAATGEAAVNLAQKDEIRQRFREKAAEAVGAVLRSREALKSNSDIVRACVVEDGNLNTSILKNLAASAKSNNLINDASVWSGISSLPELNNALIDFQGQTAVLAGFIGKNKDLCMKKEG